MQKMSHLPTTVFTSPREGFSKRRLFSHGRNWRKTAGIAQPINAIPLLLSPSVQTHVPSSSFRFRFVVTSLSIRFFAGSHLHTQHGRLFEVLAMRRRGSLPTMVTVNTDPDTTSVTRSHSTLYSLFAATYYITLSVSLTLFNKLLFSSYKHSHPPFLLLCQSITAVSILSLVSFTPHFSPPKLRQWTLDTFKAYLPLYVSNLVMLLSSLIALKFTSLLMYNTLRRTSMIFVVAIHCFVHSTRPSSYTVGATVLVTLGALWASTTDLAYDPVGYGLAFTANISTAFYLVLLRPIRDKLQLSNLQLIFVNALANIPVLLIIFLISPPTQELFQQFSELHYSLFFFCSCALAVVINHAIFVNTTVNDAIAQAICSQLKDVVLLIISIIFVDDPSQRAAGNLQGVLVGFCGSVVYGVGKIVPQRDGAKRKEQSPKMQEQRSVNVEESVTLVSNEVKTST